jgi:selenocysteine lyase/cysteine desulfurase
MSENMNHEPGSALMEKGEWNQIREQEFPAARECCYLNHAASSPLPARSVRSIQHYSEMRERPHQLYQNGQEEMDLKPLRSRLAKLLNCDAGEIGLVPSTSDGMAMAMNSLPWQESENLVLARGEYPGVVYACQNMVRRGVEVRHVAGDPGRMDLKTILEATDEGTRAIAISHVHWISGFKADIEQLGRHCRDRGITLIVDAIQSLGTQTVDVRKMNVDILVAGAFKWLLAIPGAAVIFIDHRTLPRLHPDRAGWMSMKTMRARPPELPWHDDAMRFAAGSCCDCALMALEMSVGLVLEIGVAEIEARNRALTDKLAGSAHESGLEIVSIMDPRHRSSILNVTTGSPEKNEDLHKKLLKEGIIVSLRGKSIRVAPHFYNTPEEIDRFLEACRRFNG